VLEIIRAITGEMENAVVGAGTVLTPAEYRDAVRAGAQFVVSPGRDTDITGFCRGRIRAILAGSGDLERGHATA
jgi:2-dehydro-3-deoxyphosphogluconate aldolase/(4S)-4-hydroxy-2-oxoglutarate aldolase